MPLTHAICYILNLFCKVRGEKVVKGFFNNEPRYLEPILKELETSTSQQTEDFAISEQQPAAPWVDRYILLLWLSHLLLAPFPLESMSALQPSAEVSRDLGVDLPTEVPGIALRVLEACFESLRSASKERNAAANLLVRVCIRPDMQKLGLLASMVKWSLSFFSEVVQDQADIHHSLGVLSFLSGLVASTSNVELGPFLATIYQTCRKILEQDNLAAIKSSAVARKLMVKTMRNIVLHCLQVTSAQPGLDTTAVLEEVIEYLLEAISDGDTPVRYGASKALSIITLKLDADMADEAVEAILGSLTENVYWQGTKRNVNSVNPLRWHGLTLTLAHLLYRKAITTDHLPEVLNALLLSLSFEQRSPTGGSIGTNVRDAACFGIWALSRRYSTVDLLAVDTASIRASEHRRSLRVPQVLAIELVTSACLDPAGNIRRGSSAALQELIGRHPNTIEEGIPLVQIVDFHAVGLRQRAMCEVAVKSGELQELYWEALFEALLEWRGTGSLDSDSRLFAAKAIGLFSKSKSPSVTQRMADQVRHKLAALRPREVEERQGLVSALAALVNTAIVRPNSGSVDASASDLNSLWSLLSHELKLEDKAFTSPALRPEYTAGSICNFLGAMSSWTIKSWSGHSPQGLSASEVTRLVNLCLARHEESVLEALTSAVPKVLQLFYQMPDGRMNELLESWLDKLESETSYNGLRCSGHALALGAVFNAMHGLQEFSEYQRRIVEVLTFRCTSAVAIEARTIALRALNRLLVNIPKREPQDISPLPAALEAQIGSALHIALNDYTITERGDVGSLVRLEALSAVRSAWLANILQSQNTSEYGFKIYADVLRLCLEKLDKMRVTAANVLEVRSSNGMPQSEIATPIDDVSSQAYFLKALEAIRPRTAPAFMEATLTGFINSAGMGSETVVQNARAALITFTDKIPDESSPESDSTCLLDLANCLTQLLKSNINNDRILLPLLEILAFLFDMQVLQRLQQTPFNFRILLSYTQKAHFKSTHMQKLHLALDVYRGLGVMPVTRADTLAKVVTMLLHPFPKVCLAHVGSSRVASLTILVRFASRLLRRCGF